MGLRNRVALVCDDHPIFTLGLTVLLRDTYRLDVLDADSGESALEIARKHKPFLVVTDYLMPGMSGFDLLDQLKADRMDFRGVLFSNVDEQQILDGARERGLAGCISKAESMTKIKEALGKILAGEEYFSEVRLHHLLKPSSGSEETANPFRFLTSREVQVVREIATGSTQKEIAQKMNISLRTLEKHRSNITEKLGKMTPAELTRQAYVWGVVSERGLFTSYR